MDFLLIIICNLGIPIIPLREPCFCVEEFDYIFRKYTISILLAPINTIYYSESGFHILINGNNIVPILSFLLILIAVEFYGFVGNHLNEKSANFMNLSNDNNEDNAVRENSDNENALDFYYYKRLIYFVLTIIIFGLVFFERYNEIKTQDWTQFLLSGVIVLFIPLLVFLIKTGVFYALNIKSEHEKSRQYKKEHEKTELNETEYKKFELNETEYKKIGQNKTEYKKSEHKIIEKQKAEDIKIEGMPELYDEENEPFIIYTCPNCGEKYKSNPKICFKCNNVLR